METQLNNIPLFLREFNDNDKYTLPGLCNNFKIWLHLRDSFPYPYKESDAVEFISMVNKQKPALTFAIVYNTELVGAIGLVIETDVYRKNAEVGYWIAEPYWGNGIAQASLELICEYGFEKLSLLRIYAKVFANNPASMRVLEKAGFIKECISVKAAIKNKEILDVHQYAISNRRN